MLLWKVFNVTKCVEVRNKKRENWKEIRAEKKE